MAFRGDPSLKSLANTWKYIVKELFAGESKPINSYNNDSRARYAQSSSVQSPRSNALVPAVSELSEEKGVLLVQQQRLAWKLFFLIKVGTATVVVILAEELDGNNESLVVGVARTGAGDAFHYCRNGRLGGNISEGSQT